MRTPVSVSARRTNVRTRPVPAVVTTLVTALVAALFLAPPLRAQDFRVAGGSSQRGGGRIGGQVQASAELGPRTSGFGLRVDLLYSQTPAPALSVGDLVFGGQAMRTMAAVGGLFYRREVRDFAPYVLAGGGAYEQTGAAGVALGVNAGIGVDYAGARYRPFVEARIHRLQGRYEAEVLQRRERSLISALFGFRF